MRQGLQVLATPCVRPTKRIEKKSAELADTCLFSSSDTSSELQTYKQAGKDQSTRVSASLHERQGTSEQMGVSRGKAIMRLFPRRRQTGDLLFVKHYFSESGNSFAQFSLSDLKALWEGE